VIYIKHRVNRIEELKLVAPGHGVEIDIRSDVNQKQCMHLSHDPWVKGDDFNFWLSEFQRLKIAGPLILNTKEDGLEQVIIDSLRNFGISNFIFLDTAIPTLVKYVKKGLGKHFFWRISSYETVAQALVFKGQVEWLWIDCFEGVPINYSELLTLKDDFQLCLVSPELQLQPLVFNEGFSRLKSIAKAICTKTPEKWEHLYNVQG
jgi:hypothetical protein